MPPTFNGLEARSAQELQVHSLLMPSLGFVDIGKEKQEETE